MSEIMPGLKYTSSHEWLRLTEDGSAYVGITDQAQAALGDLVYVELPEVGVELNKGDEAGVVESVKAASDIYVPVSGKVLAINEDLEDSPELINQAPYDDGWLYKIAIANAAELKAMLSEEAYAEICAAED